MSMLENQELLEIGILISKGNKSVEKEIKKWTTPLINSPSPSLKATEKVDNSTCIW